MRAGISKRLMLNFRVRKKSKIPLCLYSSLDFMNLYFTQNIVKWVAYQKEKIWVQMYDNFSAVFVANWEEVSAKISEKYGFDLDKILLNDNTAAVQQALDEAQAEGWFKYREIAASKPLVLIAVHLIACLLNRV